MDMLTKENIMFAVEMLTIILGAVFFIRKPQIQTDLKLQSLEKDVVNIRDNHIHTIRSCQEAQGEQLMKLTKEIVQLSTIISERVPKKNG